MDNNANNLDQLHIENVDFPLTSKIPESDNNKLLNDIEFKHSIYLLVLLMLKCNLENYKQTNTTKPDGHTELCSTVQEKGPKEDSEKTIEKTDCKIDSNTNSIELNVFEEAYNSYLNYSKKVLLTLISTNKLNITFSLTNLTENKGNESSVNIIEKIEQTIMEMDIETKSLTKQQTNIVLEKDFINKLFDVLNDNDDRDYYLVVLGIIVIITNEMFIVLTKDDLYDSRSRTLLKDINKELLVKSVLSNNSTNNHKDDDFEYLIDMVYLKIENNIIKEINKLKNELYNNNNTDYINSNRDYNTKRNKLALKKRLALMGLATIGGSLIIGLSAGLLAPVIGTGLGAAFTGIGVAGTGAFLHGAGGVAVITASGVLVGGGVKMEKRTRGINVFEFEEIHDNNKANVIINIAGWLNGNKDSVSVPFSTIDEINGDVYSLKWDPEILIELGSALKLFTGEVLSFATQTALQYTLLSSLLSAIAWPLALTKLGYLVDNPWSNGLDRAEKAGLVLADVLLNHAQGYRPVTLTGFSLGARVIFYCLNELHRLNAYGIIENVYIFGTPVTASSKEWDKCTQIISGKLVNGYTKTDWILGFLYRAQQTVLNPLIAGLNPITTTATKNKVINVDVSDVVKGHLAYRKNMPKLLRKVGIQVVKDEFDEIAQSQNGNSKEGYQVLNNGDSGSEEETEIKQNDSNKEDKTNNRKSFWDQVKNSTSNISEFFKRNPSNKDKELAESEKSDKPDRDTNKVETNKTEAKKNT